MRQSVGFLFDLDGVLIDSERRYTRIWREIESKFPTGIDDFPRVIKGMTLNNILAKYFPDPKVGKEVEHMCIESEKKLMFDYMPGACEMLDILHEKSIPFALVTSSDGIKMEMLRKKIPGFLEKFTAIIDGDMVKNGKPYPDPYLAGAEKIGVSINNCVVIEDSLTGIESGHRAGAFVIGMTDTLGRETIAPAADITYDSLEEIDIDSLISFLQQR